MDALRIILLLFSAVLQRATCGRWTRPSIATAPEDFFELVKTTSTADRYEQFYATLDETFRMGYAHGDYPVKFPRLADSLEAMIDLFMTVSVDYVQLRLLEYHDLAVQLIRDDEYPRTGVRQELGFPDDRVYCLVTALRDHRRRFERLFEFVCFFRTVHRYDRLALGQLESVLQNYRKLLHDRYPPELLAAARLSRPAAQRTAVVPRLREIRREIVDLSKIYCRRWPPIVSHAILSRPVADQVRNESRFVRHVYFNEKVNIQMGAQTVRKKPLVDWWVAYPNTANYWIFNWSCKDILKSQEYGFEEYKKSLNSKKEVVVSTRPERKQIVDEDEFSLAELKLRLIVNNYYVIAQKYYNIVADVMVVAAIKEGNKIFRGIKLVVRWSCSVESDDQRAETIRELRSKLFAFKSVLDELFRVLVQRNKPKDPKEMNYYKEKFDQRVGSFMRFLDPDRQYCADEIRETPANLNGDDTYPVDDPLGVLKFRGYHFDEPILHVKELYRFNVNGL